MSVRHQPCYPNRALFCAARCFPSFLRFRHVLARAGTFSCKCMCVYDAVAAVPLCTYVRSTSSFPHHTTADRIVGIPERARPNSSKVDTRPRVASLYTSRPLCRTARPTSRCRRRATAAAANWWDGGWATEKLTPWVKFRSPRFCARRVYMTSVSSCGSRVPLLVSCL